jgi:hypothetical protein
MQLNVPAIRGAAAILAFGSHFEAAVLNMNPSFDLESIMAHNQP